MSERRREKAKAKAARHRGSAETRKARSTAKPDSGLAAHAADTAPHLKNMPPEWRAIYEKIRQAVME